MYTRLSLIKFSQRRLVRLTESIKYQRSAMNFLNNYPPDLIYRRDDRSIVVRLPAEDIYKLKLNSVALVRERTIPTERPLPVGEVSANFCG